MGQTTNIEWCDSTLNLQMGCNGCELWNANNRNCYAGQLTERYGGMKGWPESFDKPKLFTERLNTGLRWSDLTGKDRPDKPWLNGLPRMIFLNDMGDTFTESLPIDWLAPLLPDMALSPHIFMLLTKRASRMAQFSKDHPLPSNAWPGVSVTTQATTSRVRDLLRVKGGGVKWVSAEPLLEAIDFDKFCPSCHGEKYIDCPEDGVRGVACNCADAHHRWGVRLVIIGGESGPNARPCNIEWIRSIVRQCTAAGVPVFTKQLGANPTCGHSTGLNQSKISQILGSIAKCLKCGFMYPKDSKGGDISEFPEDLRVRQFPQA